MSQDIKRPVQTADIVGYEGLYRITSEGKVFSAAGKSNHKYEIERKYSTWGISGYKRIVLFKTVKGVKHAKTYTVSRLVASAFIPNPLNLPVVNHID
jgi:hypothetical protein